MPKQWFANRGQILQLATAMFAIVVAVVLHVGPASQSPWVQPLVLGAGFGVALGVGLQMLLRRDGSTSNPLSFVSVEFVSDDRDQITYKRKLYITLLNGSDSEVVVGPQTAWVHRDLHVRTVSEHLWQLEGARGWRNGDWTKEAVAVRVPPGKRLRTWIGLPNDAKKSDVDHYIAEHRAGALATSVTRANDCKIVI